MSHWDPQYGAPGQGYPQTNSGVYYNANHPSYSYYQRFAQSQSQSTYNNAQHQTGDRNVPDRNVNSQGSNQLDSRNSTSKASSNSRNHFDVSNSNLQPTAVEFRPSSSSHFVNNGAVPKESVAENKGNKSRTYNNRWSDKKTFNAKREQDRAVRDAADILNKLRVNDEGADGSNNNNSRRQNESRKPDTNRRKNNFRGNNQFYNHHRDDWQPKKQYGDRKVENWRRDLRENVAENGGRSSVERDAHKFNSQQSTKKLDAGSQRERLAQMINQRTLECLVCCDRLRHADKVWSCKQCYHILHLNCIVRWAKASKLEEGWRCPACQNVLHEVPTVYKCYCDKYADPKPEPGTLPHSCGEVCGRKGRSCDHSCTILCHPGPCPDCNVMVTRSCGCGATKPTVKCSSEVQIVCQGTCNKLLNCTVHACKSKCHHGDCEDCGETVEQRCYCGKNGRSVECTESTQGVTKYECQEECGKTLHCGNHTCKKTCHGGDCEGCPSDPDVVKTCPCGQTVLSDERKSCLDPIPCCNKVCNKKLNCGQPSDPHLCQSPCHEGKCPSCPSTTMVKCRCGHMDQEIACKDLTTKADDARCKKKCTKKRMCAKHKCNQFCCIEVEHQCLLPCNHLLSCGLHRCDQTCHRGRCATCWRTSFQELYCECGSSVLYPPVACGTRPPPCNKPCSRPRECEHEPNHNCHTGPCPPCTVFTTRWCHGKHESRQIIPCYQQDFSCGLPCNKEMPCKRHRCVQTCHTGDCPNPCTQPCTTTRPNCEHSCNQPCHEPPCPNVPCKQNVVVTCQCGLRTSTRSCVDVAGEYQKIAMTQLASKMADIQRGQSVDISEVVNKPKKGGSHKMLECNDECRIVERNRRLAIGLQIRNPDLSAKLTPRYSEYMRNWAKKDARFCQNVHDKLTELVQLAKQSKQKSRSHQFECMNREKRHFVHEYCEHFGVESAAYDKEPNRNIVATAFRDKSWLPSISLIEFLQRENGQRKVPGPILNKAGPCKMAARPGEVVSLKLNNRSVVRPPTPTGEFVDYFDNPP